MLQIYNTKEILKIFTYFPGFYVLVGINTKHRIHKLEGWLDWLSRFADVTFALLFFGKFEGEKKKRKVVKLLVDHIFMSWNCEKWPGHILSIHIVCKAYPYLIEKEERGAVGGYM